MDRPIDRPTHKVVVNDAGQHALWPAYRDNAPGWRDAGFMGSGDDCRKHVAEVWADIRPTSLPRER